MTEGFSVERENLEYLIFNLQMILMSLSSKGNQSFQGNLIPIYCVVCGFYFIFVKFSIARINIHVRRVG